MNREDFIRSYEVESSVWGQAISVQPAKLGIILITTSDFDSGQTVKVGISTEDIPALIAGLEFALEDEKVAAAAVAEAKELETQAKAEAKAVKVRYKKAQSALRSRDNKPDQEFRMQAGKAVEVTKKGAGHDLADDLAANAPDEAQEFADRVGKPDQDGNK